MTPINSAVSTRFNHFIGRGIGHAGPIGLCLALSLFQTSAAQAALIGRALSVEADVALLGSNNPLQGAFSSSADGFQQYQRGISASIPPALLDEGGSDTLGIIALGDSAPFFGAVDTINTDNSETATAQWEFAVGGAESLMLSLAMAAMGDFESSDWFRWHYQLDNGPLMLLFEGLTDESDTQTYDLAGGSYNLADPVKVDGVTLSNQFQAFQAPISGTGSRLTVALSAVLNGGTEAAAFRDLQISGTSGQPPAASVPAPGTLPLLAAAAMGLLARRRSDV